MPLNLAVAASICSLFCSLFAIVNAEDPYRFFNWNVTYGDIYPLGVRQRVRPYIYTQAHIWFIYIDFFIMSIWFVFDLIID